MDEVLISGGGGLLTYGPLGIMVVGLVWFVLRQRADDIAKDAAHKIEVAAERKLNADLQSRLLSQATEHIEQTHQWRTLLENYLKVLGERE